MGEEAIQFIDRISPYQKYLYDVGAEEHTEEIAVLVHSCYSCAMSFFGDLPNYDTNLYASDQIAGYRHMHATLQTLACLKRRARPIAGCSNRRSIWGDCLA